MLLSAFASCYTYQLHHIPYTVILDGHDFGFCGVRNDVSDVLNSARVSSYKNGANVYTVLFLNNIKHC